MNFLHLNRSNIIFRYWKFSVELAELYINCVVLHAITDQNCEESLVLNQSQETEQQKNMFKFYDNQY